jgi:hypothetical protein
MSMDVLYLLSLLGFFALTWGFARLCAALEPVQRPMREERR